MTQEELFEFSEPRIGDVEATLRRRGISAIIGVDEAGRGPLAGPVYAAAYGLLLDRPLTAQLDDIDDSKKLDEATRERLYERITGGSHPYSVTTSSATVIDEINILQATFRAMKLAVQDVVSAMEVRPDLVLIDGNMTIPDGPWKQRAVVKGDRRSTAIAAASILAKVARDRFMCDAAEKWPGYGFESHKGYGTRQHRQALGKRGPCELHRLSFAGVVEPPEK